LNFGCSYKYKCYPFCKLVWKCCQVCAQFVFFAHSLLALVLCLACSYLGVSVTNSKSLYSPTKFILSIQFSHPFNPHNASTKPQHIKNYKELHGFKLWLHYLVSKALVTVKISVHPFVLQIFVLCSCYFKCLEVVLIHLHRLYVVILCFNWFKVHILSWTVYKCVLGVLFDLGCVLLIFLESSFIFSFGHYNIFPCVFILWSIPNCVKSCYFHTCYKFQVVISLILFISWFVISNRLS